MISFCDRRQSQAYFDLATLCAAAVPRLETSDSTFTNRKTHFELATSLTKKALETQNSMSDRKITEFVLFNL